jgi:hypothetical protein
MYHCWTDLLEEWPLKGSDKHRFEAIRKLVERIYFHFCFGFSHILFKSKYREIINQISRAIYVELLNEITMLAAVKD